MSRNGQRVFGVVAVLAVVLMAAVSAGATAEGRAQTEQERVISYWTAARIASAIPRDIVIDRGRAPQAKPPGTPGGGGGGGGSDDGGVTGIAWAGGGDVQQTTGKVLFTLGSSNYVCSGSAVVDSLSDHSLVLTAGHCVYDDVANVFATNWVFFPAYEDNAVLSCAGSDRCFTAAGLVTTDEWAARDFEHDYAFAVIAPSSEILLESTYGTQGIAFNQGERLGVYSFGYPHARPFNGNDLIYCAGTAKDDPYGSTTQGLACKMTGGSSGGPWFADFSEEDGTGLLYSVNSYKYQNDKNTMYGPYFGSGTQATYNAANNWSEGNILVNVP
jgi:hypothetical protein